MHDDAIGACTCFFTLSQDWYVYSICLYLCLLPRLSKPGMADKMDIRRMQHSHQKRKPHKNFVSVRFRQNVFVSNVTHIFPYWDHSSRYLFHHVHPKNKTKKLAYQPSSYHAFIRTLDFINEYYLNAILLQSTARKPAINLLPRGNRKNMRHKSCT